MDKIFSVIFLKSGIDDISDCYKILRNHKIEPVMLETRPDYYHFTIRRHKNEDIKVYFLTEYAYLLIENKNNEEEDKDIENKEETELKQDEEDTEIDVLNAIITETLADYIEMRQYANKLKVLREIKLPKIPSKVLEEITKQPTPQADA